MTFNDLKFYPHEIFCGTIAKYEFPNGYGVSVVDSDLFHLKKLNLVILHAC